LKSKNFCRVPLLLLNNGVFLPTLGKFNARKILTSSSGAWFNNVYKLRRLLVCQYRLFLALCQKEAQKHFFRRHPVFEQLNWILLTFLCLSPELVLLALAHWNMIIFHLFQLRSSLFTRSLYVCVCLYTVKITFCMINDRFRCMPTRTTITMPDLSPAKTG
jgi:hypothetical protein